MKIGWFLGYVRIHSFLYIFFYYAFSSSRQKLYYSTLFFIQLNITNINEKYFHFSSDQLLQHHNLNFGTVSNLINHSAHTWKPDLIRSLYPHTISVEILKTPISKVGVGQDKLLWKHSKSGKYQVEKAYNLLLADHNSLSSAHTSTLSTEASLTIQSLICRYQVAFNNQNTSQH